MLCKNSDFKINKQENSTESNVVCPYDYNSDKEKTLTMKLNDNHNQATKIIFNE